MEEEEEDAAAGAIATALASAICLATRSVVEALAEIVRSSALFVVDVIGLWWCVRLLRRICVNLLVAAVQLQCEWGGWAVGDGPRDWLRKWRQTGGELVGNWCRQTRRNRQQGMSRRTDSAAQRGGVTGMPTNAIASRIL